MASAVDHTYHGTYSEIHFLTNKIGLRVTVDTPRLRMRSIEPTDGDLYVSLFGDSESVRSFAEGIPKTREQVTTRVNDWVQRWRDGDSFSALPVFERDGGCFVGHVILGHGSSPGEAELAGLERLPFRGRGYGMEAARAIVLDYAPAIVAEGGRVGGKSLSKISATAIPTNEASIEILKGVGMQFECMVTRYGGCRAFYSILAPVEN